MSLPNFRSSAFNLFRSAFHSVFASAPAALFALAIATAAAALAGCTPSIGDKCVLSTDCSLAGDRLCDTSQYGGYCTIFNCTPNSCPDYAACVLFNQGVQGCGYNDRTFGRTARSFCMAGCKGDGDCRAGYVCRDVRGAPWNALLSDDNQGQKVCIGAPDESLYNTSQSPDEEAGVCQANPDVDAALPPLSDAGGADAGGADAGGADAGAGDAASADAKTD